MVSMQLIGLEYVLFPARTNSSTFFSLGTGETIALSPTYWSKEIGEALVPPTLPSSAHQRQPHGHSCWEHQGHPRHREQWCDKGRTPSPAGPHLSGHFPKVGPQLLQGAEELSWNSSNLGIGIRIWKLTHKVCLCGCEGKAEEWWPQKKELPRSRYSR